MPARADLICIKDLPAAMELIRLSLTCRIGWRSADDTMPCDAILRFAIMLPRHGYHRAAIRRAAANGRVAAWLFVCCALVFAMVVVGGVTRLTHSGLSIVEWQPIVGTLPPLSDAEWQQTFEKYQLTPEYRQVNQAMTLAEFKGIFWWEYVHRLLGRLIGVVFLVPLLWFIARRNIPPGYAWKLAGIFVLGGLQGAMGWYMVQSGLVDDPRVSQFRLTAHLGLALAIFAAMFWVGLSLVHPRRATLAWRRSVGAARGDRRRRARLRDGALRRVRRRHPRRLRLQHVSADERPLVPPEIFTIEPWWTNFFWNMATVQFDHRAIAWLLASSCPCCGGSSVPPMTAAARASGAGICCSRSLAVQIALGIATLLLVVPVPLAAAHQAGAVLVFAAALNVAHALR